MKIEIARVGQHMIETIEGQVMKDGQIDGHTTKNEER
jgi:hypothetical protein